MSAPFQLSLDPFGKLVVRLADGTQYVGAVVVRAFPIADPQRSISVLSPEGKELIWIDDLAQVAEHERNLIEQALQGREFMPEITRLDGVNSFSTPSVWRVQTNRGATELVLKGEEDIRRLSTTTLIVADAHGVQFLIRDLPALDRHTRKLLDRFL
jgi:spore germination protein YaaH